MTSTTPTSDQIKANGYLSPCSWHIDVYLSCLSIFTQSTKNGEIMKVKFNSFTKSRHAMTPLAIAVMLALTSTSVSAQQASTIETVVVTATKVDQPLLGTPNSVTVFNKDQVEDYRIRSVEDLSKYTPNLKLDSGYGAGSRGFLSIRGVGNTPGSMDPSASVYVDDVPYHDFMTYAQPLFDVKQIEVLKGSQGTLYGGFAQAGVIDIKSNLPGKEIRRSVSLDIYSPKNTRATASFSGPVNDVLSVGVSVLDERGESFIKNVTLGKRSGREQNAIRLQGVLKPDVDTEAVLTVLQHRQRNDGGSDYLPVNRATYNTFSGVNTNKFEIANNTEGFQNLNTDAQSLRLKKRTSGVEYTLVAANRETKNSYLLDFDYKPLATITSSSDDKITNQYFETRARLLPTSSQDADVTFGYSWMKQKYEVNSAYYLIKSNGTNNSLFANGRFPVNGNGLALIGGFRLEQAERDAQDDLAGGIQPTSKASKQATWKFGLSNMLANGADLYAHAATGWRPAAVNYYAWGNGPLTVDKEKSITYEAGYRSIKESQYFAAAIFLTKVNDYQETKYNTDANVPGRGHLANVAKVDIPGFEIEAKQAVTKSTNVYGGLGYTHARFDKYAEFPSLEGKPLGNRPDWNLHLGTEYKEGRMTYAATVAATDAFYSAYTTAGATTKVDGHWVGNLRATYKEKDYSLTAFVDNVANKEYFLNAGYYNYGAGFPSTEPRGQVGLPRTVGIKLKMDL
jgi:outer membrane receptor protein involved in Fe transport